LLYFYGSFVPRSTQFVMSVHPANRRWRTSSKSVEELSSNNPGMNPPCIRGPYFHAARHQELNRAHTFQSLEGPRDCVCQYFHKTPRETPLDFTFVMWLLNSALSKRPYSDLRIFSLLNINNSCFQNSFQKNMQKYF
jgi:hypothetical protein